MNLQEILSSNTEIKVSHLLSIVFVLGLAIGLTSGIAVNGFQGQKLQTDTSNNNPDQPSNSDSSAVDISKIDLEGEPSMGEEDAPVTIVEYMDYQCPFCKRHATTTLQKIKQDYIDAGKVRYVIKDFPVPQLGHDRAMKMAQAANCAQDQDMYWEVHNKFMEEQNDISPQRTAHFESSKIDQWAEEAGLNMTQYNQCMAEDRTSEINGDKSEGSSFDVTINGSPFVGGTPSFVIYGKGDETGEPVVGAQPYSVFSSKIEEKLG